MKKTNKKVHIIFYATDQTEAVFNDNHECIYEPDYTNNYKNFVGAKEWCRNHGLDYDWKEV